MDEITEAEISQRFEGWDGESRIDDMEFNQIIFSDKNYHAEYTSFYGCKFKGRLSFHNLNLKCGVRFVNCEFLSHVDFLQISVDKFNPLLNIGSESLSFVNCVFREHLEIGGSKLQRALGFDRCIFEKGITIIDLEVEKDGIEFNSCEIRALLNLFRIEVTEDLRFSGNAISGDTKINELTCRAIWYHRGNIVTGSIFKSACKIVEDITYNESRFSEQIFLRDNEIEKGGLKIFESVFDKTFNLSYRSGHLVNKTELKACTIRDSIFSGGFELEGAESHKRKPRISVIDISASSVLKGSISFTGLDIGYLKLSGHNTSASLLFKDIVVNQLKMEGLINDGGLIFSRLGASGNDWCELEVTGLLKSKLTINDTNLGKMQMFQSDLKSFDEIDIHNVILTDISTSMVNWFSHEQLENGKLEPLEETIINSKGDKNSEINKAARIALMEVLQSRREIYRQLKYAAQKQGDMPQSLKFQHREMKYYYKINKYRKPRQWSEFLILWSNQSNRYGQSWLRALKYLGIWSFIAYTPVGFLSSPVLDYGTCANESFDIYLNLKVVFWDNLKTWIVLMNPTHRMSDISGKISEYPSIIYFFDLLSRIVVSYFIFQMVTAFRKFSK